MRLKAKHPVRNAFCTRSTGAENGQYYSTKSKAINAFDGELQEHDMWLCRDELAIGFSGDYGRRVITVYQDNPADLLFSAPVCEAVLTWYKMPSGNYEFIGYLT